MGARAGALLVEEENAQNRRAGRDGGGEGGLIGEAKIVAEPDDGGGVLFLCHAALYGAMAALDGGGRENHFSVSDGSMNRARSVAPSNSPCAFRILA